MTDSDAALKKRLAYQRKMLVVCEARGHEWTAEKYRQYIAYTERQLALPRDQRSRYEVGSL